MNCTQMSALLDRLLDGELTDEQRRDMEAHGRECPACAEQLRGALQLKALLSEMEPEADVPLAAQAKWRGAVREEAGQRRRRVSLRRIGSAAAAVVVLAGLGLTVSLRNAPKAQDIAGQSAAGDTVEAPALYAAEAIAAGEDSAFDGVNGAFVEADGGAVEESLEESFEEAAPEEMLEAEEEAALVEDAAFEIASVPRASMAMGAPTCELLLAVEDVDKACAGILDLAEEYEAVANVQRLEDGSANIYVEIGAENAADFMSAVIPMGVSDEAPAIPEFPEAGTELMLVRLSAAE